jgi:Fic family protein
MKQIRFNGSDYEPEVDDNRLTNQLAKIFDLMRDGKFRTLREIEKITKCPQASVSAQLRHLRKERFGSHVVNKRSRDDRKKGLFEYQLVVNKN